MEKGFEIGMIVVMNVYKGVYGCLGEVTKVEGDKLTIRPLTKDGSIEPETVQDQTECGVAYDNLESFKEDYGENRDY